MEAKRAIISADFKPVERFLKRYETLTSKDSSSRRPDAREQIIEEQIEEYKKKREKVLGGQSVVTFPLNETQKEVQEEEISAKLNFVNMEEEVIIPKVVGKRGEEVQGQEQDRKQEQAQEQEQEQEQEQGEEQDEKVVEEDREEKLVKDEKIENQEKSIDNVEEHLSKSRLKLKWEETKRKKESLQKELDESYSEPNLEKLAKVLGEREKNLQVIFIILFPFIKLIIFAYSLP